MLSPTHVAFKKSIIPVGLFLVSLGYLSWGMGVGMRIFDEGNFVYGADCILHGQLPYRDFFTIYFPAQFYTLALTFKIFGESLIAERCFSIAVYSLISVLGFLIAKKIGDLRFALLSWFLIALWFGAFGFLYYSTPAPTAIVFSLFSCLFFIAFIKSGRRWQLFVAGICAGLCTLFRQDIGLYTTVSETAVALLFLYAGFSRDDVKRMKAFLQGLFLYRFYVFGVLSVLLPVGVFFLTRVRVGDLAYSLVQWPLFIQPKYGALPYPAPLPNPLLLISGKQSPGPYFMTGVLRAPFYFPVAVFSAAVIVLILVRRSNRQVKWILLLILLLGLSSLNLARERSDLAHLYPATVPAMILLAPLLGDGVWADAGRTRTAIRFLLVVCALLMVASLGLYCSKALPPAKENLVSPDLERARGIYLNPSTAANLEEAVKFVRARTSANETIFVGNVRHDRSTINDIMFYFLAERRSATKYFALAPGLVTTEAVQREMVRDLIRHRVNCIVIWTGSQQYLNNELHQESDGVRILDDFVRREYLPVRTFGDYLILCSRDYLSQHGSI